MSKWEKLARVGGSLARLREAWLVCSAVRSRLERVVSGSWGMEHEDAGKDSHVAVLGVGEVDEEEG